MVSAKDLSQMLLSSILFLTAQSQDMHLSPSDDKKLERTASLLENRKRFQNDCDKLEKRSEKWHE